MQTMLGMEFVAPNCRIGNMQEWKIEGSMQGWINNYIISD